MRVALLHNTSSGSEDHTDEELSELMGRVGLKVVHIVRRVSELTEALHEHPCDLVVVAGGDGTVGRTACELSGWPVPIAIVPLGTANNTARSLELPLRVKKLIKSLKNAAKVPFDLGLLDDGALCMRFAECVGWGVFARTIAEAKLRDSGGSVRQTLKRDRRLFGEIARKLDSRPYEIEVDGRDCSGDYMLVEVMNIGLLGPQLPLSPGSDSSDGELEVVLVESTQRAALERIAESTEPEADGYRIERGRHIRVRTDQALLHRDGKLVRHAPGTRAFEIRVEPAAIHYLR